MIIKPHGAPSVISADRKPTLRCPGCRQLGTFNQALQHDLRVSQLVQSNPPKVDHIVLGLRTCPNPDCHAEVFVVMRQGLVEASYPAQRIDFDSSGIPSNVVESLEEAITCQANACYVAAAIMVRKTLEELCRDRGAVGNNLKERLVDLRSKVILPGELLDGLDDLRLLGNDAAHIESRVYDKVTETEVEIGIEFAKEVLKALYQYAKLLDRLRSLRDGS